MAEPKFETISFSVRQQGNYSRQFKMNRVCRKPRPFWEVKDSSGNSMGEGYSTDEALLSLATRLSVARDEIKKSAVAYECWNDGKLAYRICVERDGCHIYDSNGAPVGNRIFDTYTKARTYCVEILR